MASMTAISQSGVPPCQLWGNLVASSSEGAGLSSSCTRAEATLAV